VKENTVTKFGLKSILAMLVLTCLTMTSGCGLFGTMTPQQLAPMIGTGCETAASLAVSHKVLTTDLASKTVTALTAVQPTVAGLQTSGDITTALLPAINAELAKAVPDATSRAVVAGVIQEALNVAVNYLNNKYPQYKNNQAAVVAIASAAVQGTIDGLKQGIAAAGG
jgi:hypothetical protein